MRAWLAAFAALLMASPASAQCLDPPGLPRVRATGTLAEALRQCGEGCVVDLEPRAYPDTAVLIGQRWLAEPSNQWINKAFPKGLVLNGSPGTVLQSPIFQPGYSRPVVVLRFDRAYQGF